MKGLRVFQLNLNKSEIAHLDIINRALSINWDIILIQEPYLTHLGHVRAPNGFVSVFPTDRLVKQEDPVRSVIWVSSSLSSNSWKAISIPGNNDLTAIQADTGPIKVTFFNIYNDCTHSSTLVHLRDFLQAQQASLLDGDDSHMFWCGDFNRHHPM